MTQAAVIDVEAVDGHRFQLIARMPASPRQALHWLPAMGVTARHYIPFADALASRGIAVFLHEWRGNGSSSLRASRDSDWGYRELLQSDIPAAMQAIRSVLPAEVPMILGGHSLGGQLACCRMALAPGAADALWLVASGAPYWRTYPLAYRVWLPLVYRFAPWLAARRGHLPGRRIRFAGNEARTLVADWALSGLSGRYAARGITADLEAKLAEVRVPVRCLVPDSDWLVPRSSARFLVSRLSSRDAVVASVDRQALGARADHFSWMQAPAAVADWLADAPLDQAPA